MVELSGNSPKIGTAISDSPTLELGLMTTRHFRFQLHFRSDRNLFPVENADRFLAACCPKRASAWLQRRHWAFHLETISRFSIVWAATSPARFEPEQLAYQQPTPLNDVGVARVLDALPTRPLLAGQEGLRLSLAGAQSKVPVVMIDGQIALPLPDQATTHILKPPIVRFPGTTENEAVVMMLAAVIGLDVALVETRFAEGRPFLLVERYDRVRDDSGIVRRIHQEDFCQALSIPPEAKYASEGGPTFKDCFELLRRVSERPATDIMKLLDAAIFNLIVGNADAHGKNFSILYDDQGPRMAPLYDLLSTVAYPDFSPKMAMRMGRRATLAEMDADGWKAFAKEIGVGLPLVRRRVTELADATRQSIARVSETISPLAIDPVTTNHVAALIADRAKLVVLSI